MFLFKVNDIEADRPLIKFNTLIKITILTRCYSKLLIDTAEEKLVSDTPLLDLTDREETFR